MKIGLVRHFKVDCPHKVMMTSKEFREWSEKYELTCIKFKTVISNKKESKYVRNPLGCLLLQ